MRGYDVGTFTPANAVPTAISDCPAYDQLIGSRMLVANVEFRFPLLRPFGASQRMYGPVPVEVALFADGGVAWNQRDEAVRSSAAAPQGGGSVGVAFRVNLLGFAGRRSSTSRARSSARQKGWVFQFNLLAGVLELAAGRLGRELGNWRVREMR